MLDDTIPISNSDASNSQADPIQSENQVEEIAQPQETPQEPPPPAGDEEKAEKYLNQLLSLINADKLTVVHTDLNKFEIASIQDHYRMDLGEYEVEINHSKQPDTGQDFYVMLFNNIKKIEDGGQNCVNKVILAYTHLIQTQFETFKEAADASIERRRKAEEAKRFSEAMNPIDNLLSDLSSSAPAQEESTYSNNSQAEAMASDETMKDEKMPEELSDADMENQNEEPRASDHTTQPAFTI